MILIQNYLKYSKFTKKKKHNFQCMLNKITLQQPNIEKSSNIKIVISTINIKKCKPVLKKIIKINIYINL